MTNPLIQAIKDRMEALQAEKPKCTDPISMTANTIAFAELRWVKKLAIAEQERIIKAFIDSCIVQEGNPPPIFRFPRDAIKIVKNEK